MLSFGCSAAVPWGAAAGNSNEAACAEELTVPADFLKPQESGPPTSWVLLGGPQPTKGFYAVRRAEYQHVLAHGNDVRYASEVVRFIAIGARPQSPPQSSALAFERSTIEKECPGAVTRTDILATSDEYVFDDSIARCGSKEAADEVTRYLYGRSTEFQIQYIRLGPPLDYQERNQVVQLVSSFRVRSGCEPAPTPGAH